MKNNTTKLPQITTYVPQVTTYVRHITAYLPQCIAYLPHFEVKCGKNYQKPKVKYNLPPFFFKKIPQYQRETTQ